MLYIFGQSAQEPEALQDLIRAQVCATESGVAIQERQDGQYVQTFRLETTDEMFQRFSEEEAISVTMARRVFASDSPSEQKLTGATRPSSQVSPMVSTSVRKDDGNALTLADIPVGWNFGNGVTLNAHVTLRDGTSKTLSWVVFPDAQESVVRSNVVALRVLVEGS